MTFTNTTFEATPVMRPCSVAISRDLMWCLRRLSEAVRGKDGRLEPHCTPDGIASALLQAAIEREYPDLLKIKQQRDKAKTAFNADAVKLCQKQP